MINVPLQHRVRRDLSDISDGVASATTGPGRPAAAGSNRALGEQITVLKAELSRQRGVRSAQGQRAAAEAFEVLWVTIDWGRWGLYSIHV